MPMKKRDQDRIAIEALLRRIEWAVKSLDGQRPIIVMTSDRRSPKQAAGTTKKSRT